MSIFLDRSMIVLSASFLLFALLCTGEVDFGILGSTTCVVGIYIVLFILTKRIKKHYSVIVFVVSLVFYILILLLFNYPQVSDYAVQIDAARELLNGNEQVFHSSFFESWSHFIGYTLLEAFLLSIYNKVFIIKLFEALCSAGSVVILYSIICKVTSDSIAKTTTGLFALFPTFAFMNITANNQILACFLFLVSFKVYISIFSVLNMKQIITRGILTGTLVGLAQFIRPDSVLVFATFIISCFFIPSIPALLNNDSIHCAANIKTRLNNTMRILSPIVLSFLIVTIVLGCALHESGLQSTNTSNKHVAVDKIIMGTDLETGGTWSPTYVQQVQERAEEQGISYQHAALTIVLDRLSNPIDVLNLEIEKTKTLWWGHTLRDFALYDAPAGVVFFIHSLDKAIVFILIITNLISLCLFKRITDGRIKVILRTCFLMFLLSAFAYLIIEVQPRYLYMVYPFMFIIGAYGLEYLHNIILNCKKNMTKST